ncbi:MAG: hypothetical protein ACXW2I_05525 [Burkholderiales bacterium]
MAWLIVPVVVVVLVYLAGFRKSALGLLVAAVLAAFLLYQYNQRLQEQARTRIASSEVVVENVSLRATFGSSYDLVGTIRNNSESYRLDGISFKVTMRDCEGTDNSRCVGIAEATTHVPISLPPQQARDFTGSLYFGKQIKTKGTLSWNYEVIAITAKRQ